METKKPGTIRPNNKKCYTFVIQIFMMKKLQMVDLKGQ
jgi:hypothetical protein